MVQATNPAPRCPFLEDTDDPVAQVSGNLALLMRILHRLKQHGPQVRGGLDATAYPLLFTLAHGSLRISALAEKVYSDVSTISRQVTTLEKLGYVQRTPDPNDGRASQLGLTDAGAAFITDLVEQRNAYLREVLTDWSPDDVRHLAHLLARFQEDLAHRAPSSLPTAQGGHP